MKINDYVKYDKNIYRLVKIKDGFVMLENIDIAIAKNVCKLLTPEETLEMFKGRFEKLGYHNTCLERGEVSNRHVETISFDEYDIHFENENGGQLSIDNTLIDLIREFQKWYWGDK